MKKILRIIILTPIVLLMFSIATSWFVFEYKKEWLQQELLLFINDSFQGELFIKKLEYDPISGFPYVGISLKGVDFFEAKGKASNQKIFSISSVNLDFDLRELITNSKIRIERVVIDKASLELVESQNGWNIERGFSSLVRESIDKNASDSETPFVMDIENLRINHFDLSVLLAGNKKAEKIIFEDVAADLVYENDVLNVDMISKEELDLAILKEYGIKEIGTSTLNAAFSIDIESKKIQVDKGTLGFNSGIYNFEGFYDYNPSQKILLNFKGYSLIDDKEKEVALCKFSADLGERSKRLNLSLSLNGVKLHEALGQYDAEQLAKGMVDLDLELKFKGNSFSSFLKDTRADIKVHGSDIMLYGLELDKLLKNYKNSQNFSLVDIGAFALAGPFGAVAVKGSDFTKLLTTKFKDNDSSRIQEIILEFDLSHGILSSKDVAFSTDNNRLALIGTLDVVKDSIPACEIVVLTKESCAVLSQKFHGNLTQIELEEVKVVKTLMGSVVNLLNKIAFIKCDPVYFGSIKHPIPIDPDAYLLDGNTMHKVFDKR